VSLNLKEESAIVVVGITVSFLQSLNAGSLRPAHSAVLSEFPSLKHLLLAASHLQTPKLQASELGVESNPLKQPSCVVIWCWLLPMQADSDARLSQVVVFASGDLTQALHAVSAAFAKQDPRLLQIVCVQPVL